MITPAMITIPQQLDWVAKRAQCTAAGVFKDLWDAVRGDVDAINTARELTGLSVFKAKMVRPDEMSVCQTDVPLAPITLFSLSGDRIVVTPGLAGREPWSARVGLNDQGRCTLRFEVGSEKIELEQWQFRKRALEEIFFEVAP